MSCWSYLFSSDCFTISLLCAVRERERGVSILHSKYWHRVRRSYRLLDVYTATMAAPTGCHRHCDLHYTNPSATHHYSVVSLPPRRCRTRLASAPAPASPPTSRPIRRPPSAVVYRDVQHVLQAPILWEPPQTDREALLQAALSLSMEMHASLLSSRRTNDQYREEAGITPSARLGHHPPPPPLAMAVRIPADANARSRDEAGEAERTPAAGPTAVRHDLSAAGEEEAWATCLEALKQLQRKLSAPLPPPEGPHDFVRPKGARGVRDDEGPL